MISGIYKIENKINHKKYYGSSCDIIGVRWPEHKRQLKNKIHDNKYFENAWYQYGDENFTWEIIEECAPEILLEREQYWLDTVRIKNSDGMLDKIDKNLSYNICCIAGSCLGCIRTEETKNKMKLAQSGSNHPLFGKHHTEETKKKMSIALSGEKNYLFGKHLSEEAKQKISDAQKGEKGHNFGKQFSDEHREKISKSMIGHLVSEETRQKISQKRIGVFVGEKSVNAKLTWKKVREIRERYITGNYTQKQLGEEYEVGIGAISHIIHNRTWKENL